VGYGFLLNPALGGYLADPVRQYPDSQLVEALDSFLDLTANPFLLPNLVGGILCLSAYFLVSAFVEETLPADQIEPLFEWRSRPVLAVSSLNCEREDHDDHGRGVSIHVVPTDEVKVLETEVGEGEKETATIRSLLGRRSTRSHLILYWGLTPS